MQEYEYISYEICMPRAEQEKEVEKMAKQGWRLVSVVGYVFWFERHLTKRAVDVCHSCGGLRLFVENKCAMCGKRR